MKHSSMKLLNLFPVVLLGLVSIKKLLKKSSLNPFFYILGPSFHGGVLPVQSL